MSIASTAAFAASLKLDSSHICTAYTRLKYNQVWELACLRKRWFSHNIPIASTAAFAASLKLDSSHICPAYTRLKYGQTVGAGLPAKAVVQAQHVYRQYRRLRSLAKARQLPHLPRVHPLEIRSNCGSGLAREYSLSVTEYID